MKNKRLFIGGIAMVGLAILSAIYMNPRHAGLLSVLIMLFAIPIAIVLIIRKEK